MSDRKRSIFGVVFLTIFLDMVGFSIIFPLFPDMLDHYLFLEQSTTPMAVAPLALLTLSCQLSDAHVADTTAAVCYAQSRSHSVNGSK